MLIGVGKKGAGKRINFALGMVCFHQSIFLCLLCVFIFMRHFLGALHITEKGFAKAGLLQTESSTKTEPSKNHSRFFKITKK